MIANITKLTCSRACCLFAGLILFLGGSISQATTITTFELVIKEGVVEKGKKTYTQEELDELNEREGDQITFDFHELFPDFVSMEERVFGNLFFDQDSTSGELTKGLSLINNWSEIFTPGQEIGSVNKLLFSLH